MESTILRPAGAIPATFARVKNTTVIWKDSFDGDQIFIGTERVEFGRKTYIAWITCHIDALDYLTPGPLARQIREAGAADFPFPCEFGLRVRALEEIDEGEGE